MKAWIVGIAVSIMIPVVGSAAEPQQSGESQSSQIEYRLPYMITAAAQGLLQAPRFRSAQAQQQQSRSATSRSWCFRHSAGCGALIGYAAGLTIGLAHPPGDFSNHRGGFAVGIMGPLGAGIGAAVGCCHH
jgi:hypothetical protein